ncbi:MAG: hypothetical protein ABI867_18060 [Kofleriaceae bacterium]
MTKLGVIALALAACGTSDPPPEPGDTFLAFSSSFADFRSWPMFHSDGPAAGTQPPDVLGPRSQFVNELPASGLTEWPVGTLVVESRENGTNHILAAVKRGGGFNGGRNWEWFELLEEPVVIVWRGVGPPDGETYGGDPDGGCNSCHEACGASNDFICSPFLQLANF